MSYFDEYFDMVEKKKNLLRKKYPQIIRDWLVLASSVNQQMIDEVIKRNEL